MVESESEPRQLIVDLSKELYERGWTTRNGGGVSVRHADRIFVAPGGLSKHQLTANQVFELNLDGEIVGRPDDLTLSLSPSAPLFMNAYRLRGAGAVLHSYSMNAMLATLISGGEWKVTHLEMMKGIRGVGYHDQHTVPIIENTSQESALSDTMAEAILSFPETQAVLIRRHGAYVWGRDWAETKAQAECYDYLFEASVRMRQLGIDPAERPR